MSRQTKKEVFWVTFWTLLSVLNVFNVLDHLADYDFAFNAILLSLAGLTVGLGFVMLPQHIGQLISELNFDKLTKRIKEQESGE